MTPIAQLTKLYDRFDQIKNLQGKARIDEVVAKRIYLLEVKLINLEQYLGQNGWKEDAYLFLYQEAERESNYLEELLFNTIHSSFIAESNSHKYH